MRGGGRRRLRKEKNSWSYKGLLESNIRKRTYRENNSIDKPKRPTIDVGNKLKDIF